MKWSVLDGVSSFWQIPTKPADQPFGLKNAPATFQRFADKVLQGLPADRVKAYLDDTSIATRTEEEHLDLLTQTLSRYQAYNFRLKPAKCQVMRSEVKLLGCKVSKKGN
eukprot:TRINITY_DN11472_c0_g2_i1.p2 TRINITY_DN11472_c0_g2~~TRINITY_DN11472_c0_g2_i1.p2  ORF type:complete len:119 (+),score=1.00 TRINITY_DN11472_c0_g2_i1:32-358(+)